MFFSVLSLARGLVCHDSAASHVASAVGIPMVALMNTTRIPLIWACTQPRNFCIQDILPASVVAALEELDVL
jgi:ADP-heptose:LPS heptosyltransferase